MGVLVAQGTHTAAQLATCATAAPASKHAGIQGCGWLAGWVHACTALLMLSKMPTCPNSCTLNSDCPDSTVHARLLQVLPARRQMPLGRFVLRRPGRRGLLPAQLAHRRVWHVPGGEQEGDVACLAYGDDGARVLLALTGQAACLTLVGAGT